MWNTKIKEDENHLTTTWHTDRAKTFKCLFSSFWRTYTKKQIVESTIWKQLTAITIIVTIIRKKVNEGECCEDCKICRVSFCILLYLFSSYRGLIFGVLWILSQIMLTFWLKMVYPLNHDKRTPYQIDRQVNQKLFVSYSRNFSVLAGNDSTFYGNF